VDTAACHYAGKEIYAQFGRRRNAVSGSPHLLRKEVLYLKKLSCLSCSAKVANAFWFLKDLFKLSLKGKKTVN